MPTTWASRKCQIRKQELWASASSGLSVTSWEKGSLTWREWVPCRITPNRASTRCSNYRQQRTNPLSRPTIGVCLVVKWSSTDTVLSTIGALVNAILSLTTEKPSQMHSWFQRNSSAIYIKMQILLTKQCKYYLSNSERFSFMLSCSSSPNIKRADTLKNHEWELEGKFRFSDFFL